MSLRDEKRQTYTMTVDGQRRKLRFDLNALDYLERKFGAVHTAFEDRHIRTQKHILRAALMCNYPENVELLESNDLASIRPTLDELGEWFDLETVEAVAENLYDVFLKQITAQEGEKRLGKPPVELLMETIGALSRLYGRRNLEEAWANFGAAHPEK